MMVKLLYPENDLRSDAEIIGWAHDAMVNDAVDEHVRQHGPLPDEDEPGRPTFASIAEPIKEPSLEDAMEYLADTGRATFARCQPF